MNDMERRKFEDSFQEAFKDAEINPSETVWTNIELDLERAAGDKMKRRLVFFKMLAAASVIFALGVGGIGYYIFLAGNNNANLAEQADTRNSDGANVAADQQEVASAKKDNGEDKIPGNEGDSAAAGQLAENGSDAFESNKKNSGAPERLSKSTTDNASIRQKNRSPHEANGVANETDKQPNLAHAPDVNRSNSNNTTPLKEGNPSDGRGITEQGTSQKAFANTDNSQNVNNIKQYSGELPLMRENESAVEKSPGIKNEMARELPAFYEPKLPELQLPSLTADAGMVLLAKLADEEKRYAADQKTKKNTSEKLWTSVGFAAGGFDANNPNITPTPSNSLHSMTNSTLNTATKQSKASGVAYSLGVSLGTKLSDRWVLQGGINYLTQSSDYTANSVVVVDNNYGSLKAESLNAFSSQTMDASAQPKVAQTFPYNVNNSVRFVSVPLQAGYLVLNRKFGLQVNAGVSTDLFLQNTITPDGGGVTKTTQGRGDDSPYRTLNFSGLMGTELSYKLGPKYRVSLNPGLRYPLNSVYKSNTGIDATPVTFDVGLRFRYIFH